MGFFGFPGFDGGEDDVGHVFSAGDGEVGGVVEVFGFVDEFFPAVDSGEVAFLGDFEAVVADAAVGGVLVLAEAWDGEGDVDVGFGFEGGDFVEDFAHVGGEVIHVDFGEGFVVAERAEDDEVGLEGFGKFEFVAAEGGVGVGLVVVEDGALRVSEVADLVVGAVAVEETSAHGVGFGFVDFEIFVEELAKEVGVFGVVGAVEAVGGLFAEEGDFGTGGGGVGAHVDGLAGGEGYGEEEREECEGFEFHRFPFE